MARTPHCFERRQLGLQFPQSLLAVSPLPLFLLEIVTDDIATPTLALTSHPFLHAQVLRSLLRAPRTL
jgi:hypothetical protein